jgi:hypothetical protein
MLYSKTDFEKNQYFTANEFQCKCGKCSEPLIDATLMVKLTIARKNANIPFRIASGCRCEAHNKAVKGASNSDHLFTGNIATCGVDILCKNDSDRFTILKALFDAGFRRFGVHKSFIHAGLALRNPGGCIWFY